MSTACNYRSPDGTPSLLYAQLEQKLGTERATDIWYQVQAKFTTEPSFDVVNKEFNLMLTNSSADPIQVDVSLLSEMREVSETGIRNQIDRLYEEARKNPDIQYNVPFKRNHPGIKVGTDRPRIGMKELAGWFSDAGPIPKNVFFHPSFEDILGTLPSVFLPLWPSSEFGSPEQSGKAMKEQFDRQYVKVRDGEGNETGEYFNYDKQQEAIDSLVYMIYSNWVRKPSLVKISAYMNLVRQTLNGYQRTYWRIVNGDSIPGFDGISPELAKARATDIGLILNSLFVEGTNNHLWHFTMQRLKAYGISTVGGNITEENTGDLEEQGRSIENYYDQSFEIDRKDTASARLKFWLSNTEMTEPMRFVALSFNDALIRNEVLEGARNVTIRKKELTDKLNIVPGQTVLTKIDGNIIRVIHNGIVQEDEVSAFQQLVGNEITVEPGMVVLRLEKVEDNSTFATKRNYLGLPKLVNFEHLFSTLINKLANTKLTSENVIRILQESSDPAHQRVSTRLKAALDTGKGEIVNEFISVMNNQYQQFMMLLHGVDDKKEGLVHRNTRLINVNRSGQIDIVRKEWQEMQKLSPIAINTEAGLLKLNTDLILDFHKKLKEVQEAFENKSEDATTKGVILMRYLMKSNGIELPDSFYEGFLKNIRRITANTGFPGNFEGQFKVNNAGKPIGMFSTFIHSYTDPVDPESDESPFTLQNPLYNEAGRVTRMLVSEALDHYPKLYSKTHQSGDKKTIYDHGLPSAVSEEFTRMLEDESFRQLFKGTYINEHNWLLKELDTNQELRSKMQLVYMDTIKNDTSKNKLGVPPSKMSTRERILFSLAAFEKQGNKKYADYVDLTHADKTHTPVLINAPRIEQVSTWFDGVQVVSSDGLKALFNLFKGEYNRIRKTALIEYDNENFNKGKGFFFNLPEFNYDALLERQKQGLITKDEFNMLWTDSKVLKPLETPGLAQMLTKVFNQLTDEWSDVTLQTWKAEGLDVGSLPFGRNYANRLMTHFGFQGSQSGYMDMNANVISKKTAEDILMKAAARDYTVNGILFNSSFGNLFYGDPAQFFKGNIPSTMTDYKKRLAKDIAPGKMGNTAHSPKVSYLVAKDIKAALSELEVDVKVVHTDAQEIITVKEWLDNQYAHGTITQKLYEEMVATIERADGGPYSFSEEGKQVIMQAQKPVYVGNRNVGQGVILKTYVKSSAYVLIPEMTAGKELDKLRIWMERNKVGRLAFGSAVKAGSPGQLADVFTNDGKVNNPKDWEKSIITLPRDGFRIQQENPYKGNSEEIGIVTQMNKTILEGTEGMTFTLPDGKTYTSQELSAHKEQTRISMLSQSLDALRKRILKADGSTNFKEIARMIKDEMDSRAAGYSENDEVAFEFLDDTGRMLLPMIFTPSYDRLEPLLMSLVTKAVKIDIPGRAYIQASPAGQRSVAEEKGKSKRALDAVDAKELYKKVKKVDTPSSAYLLALEYIADGGKVDNNSIKKEVVQEAARERDYAVNNPAKSLDNIAHSLWEDLKEDVQQKVTEDDLKNELADAISTFKTRREAAEKYLLKTDPEYATKVVAYDSTTDMKGIVTVGDYDGGYLKTLRVENGVIRPAQVLVPFRFYDKKGNLLNINDFIKQVDGKNVIDEEKLPKELLELIGARIPNQGHSSMLPIEIVGFLPEQMGDLVVVPAAITYQMGADFDVDKLFTYQRGYEYKDGKLQKDMSNPYNQEYFNIHWGVLMNPEMIGKVMSPLDKPDIAIEANKAEMNKTETNYYHPIRQVKEYISERDAKALVGLSSLSVTFNAVTQPMDLGLIYYDMEEDKDGNFVMTEKEYSLKVRPKASEIIKLNRFSGVGKGYNLGEKRTKHDHLTTMQNAFLDNAKNPYSDKINLNMTTYPAAAALMQLSAGVDDTIVNIPFLATFLRQPILIEYVEAIARSSDSISTEKIDKDTFINTMIGKLRMELTKMTDANFELEAIDEEEMNKVLEGIYAADSFEYKQIQYEVLKTFSTLLTLGNYLQDLQRSINHDTKGAGKDAFRLYTNMEIPDTLKTSFFANNIGISNVTDLWEMNKEQGFLRYSVETMASKLIEDFLPYGTIAPIMKDIRQMLGRAYLPQEFQQEMVTAYRSTKLIEAAKEVGLFSNTERERARLLYNIEGPSLPRRIQKARETWGKSSFFLQRLQTTLALDQNEPDRLSYSVVRASMIDEVESTRGWIDLLASDDTTKKELGEDLVRWVLLMDTRSALARHIPVSYMLSIGLHDKLQEPNIEKASYMDDLIRHYPYLAPNISDDFSETGTKYKYPPNSFVLPKMTADNMNAYPAKGLMVRNSTRTLVHAPYLSYYNRYEKRWFLYTLSGIIDEGALYARTELRGNNYIDEWSAGESVIQDNKIPNMQLIYAEGKKTIAQETTDADNPYGLKEVGTKEDLIEFLEILSTDTSQPSLVREMAIQFSDLERLIPEQDISKAFGRPQTPIRYQIGGIDTGAQFDSNANVLNIHREMLSSSKLGMVMIHELIHYHTAFISMFSALEESDVAQGIVDGKSYAELRFGKMYETYKLNSKFSESEIAPKVKETMQQIDGIRKEALLLLKKEMEAAGLNFQELFKKVSTGEIHKSYEAYDEYVKNMPNDYGLLMYHLASNTEFMAGLFNEKSLMSFLNKYQYSKEQRSLLDRLHDFIARLLSYYAELLGMDVNRGSLLEAGVKETMRLIKDDYILGYSTPILTNGTPPITNKAFPESAPTNDKISKLIVRLQEQRNRIQATFTGVNNRAERAKKRKLLEDIDQQISDLAAQKDLKMVAVIGNKQLKWVDGILKSKSPTPNDIITAQKITSTWENLVRFLYDLDTNASNIDPEWKQLVLRATESSRTLMELSIKAHQTIASRETDGAVRMRDYSIGNIKDVDFTEVRLRSLSASSNSRMVQYIATHIENTGRAIDEDTYKFVRRMFDLQEEVKKLMPLEEFQKAITQSGTSQTEWGLINPHSGEWLLFLSKSRKRLYSTLSKLGASDELPSGAKVVGRQTAWRRYWADLTGWSASEGKFSEKPNAVVVDVRKAINPNTGKFMDTPEALAEKERIVKLVGEEIAEQAIAGTEKRYQQYLEEKEATEFLLQSEVEEGSKTQEEAYNEMNAYISKYSPASFMDNLTKPLKQDWEHVNEKYLLFIPVKESFYDKKYKDMKENNKPLYALYNKYRAELDRLKSFLPIYVQDNMSENFLPFVKESLVRDALTVPDYIKGIPSHIMKSLTASSYEEQMIQYDKIPLRFLQPEGSEDISRDPFKVIKAFGAMAIHYNHFANAKDVIDLGQNLLQEFNRHMLDIQTDKSAGLKNTLDGLRYMQEYMIFKQARALEGNTGVKLYSLNPMKQFKEAAKAKELAEKQYQTQRDYVDGKIDQEEYEEQMANWARQMPEGRTLYGSKLGDSLIRYGQLKALSFNPFSAVANLSFGLVSTSIYAAGGEDMDTKTFLKAFSMMMGSSTKKWGSAGLSNNDMARKILNLMDRLGIMGDVVESNYGKVEFREEKSKTMRMLNPYQWLRSSDYFMKGMNTLAMMLHRKVSVTENGETKEISLWEAHNMEGVWDKERFGERPEWVSDDPGVQTAWNVFKNRAVRVNTIIMGNADKNSPKMLSKWVWGRLLGQFRLSWLPEGWYNRFGAERHDIQLDRTIKGRYLTYKSLGIGGSIINILRQYAATVSSIDPFKKTFVDGEPIKEWDIANMKRNFVELNWYLTITAAILIIDNIVNADKDDEDKFKTWQMVRNLLMRTNQDVRFYTSPQVFDALTRDVVPALNVIKDFSAVIPATYRWMFDDEYEYQEWLHKVFKAGLPLPQATMINKIKYMTEKDIEDLGR